MLAGVKNILQFNEEHLNIEGPVKIAFDMAKNKIKSKDGKSDNNVERNEFRLLIIFLQHYFEYLEFFIQ